MVVIDRCWCVEFILVKEVMRLKELILFWEWVWVSVRAHPWTAQSRSPSGETGFHWNVGLSG